MDDQRLNCRFDGAAGIVVIPKLEALIGGYLEAIRKGMGPTFITASLQDGTTDRSYIGCHRFGADGKSKSVQLEFATAKEAIAFFELVTGKAFVADAPAVFTKEGEEILAKRVGDAAARMEKEINRLIKEWTSVFEPLSLWHGRQYRILSISYSIHALPQ